MIGLRCVDLTKCYNLGHKKNTVLDKVNFSVKKGEKLGILGRNGAGKSTLIKVIGGVEPITSGNIEYNMTVSWPLAFGGAFQGSLSGHDNLRFICRVYDLDYNETLDYVQGFAQLGKQFYDPVKTYSSGMHARLAFALSLAIEFDCYLIDEVIMVGDARFAQRCEDELFGKRADRTLLIVSHNMDFMRQVCDRAVLLHNKKIHESSSVDEAIYSYFSL
ncbi:ABC transporter ATP-binding protein [Bombella sp. TMW 2.2543]|uniref:ABC transporter ATP-binding protein n=1 Tax=Bombella pluederhausensis TaxID=2967336 RepID=A0ABT3WII1_9PROT|nr:ABC transporter ATP-binding protein [Bombella pluederhausensis]MCX5617627.1 ABC transporter ATP-binding protein [Bombella pluederhausensis]